MTRPLISALALLLSGALPLHAQGFETAAGSAWVLANLRQEGVADLWSVVSTELMTGCRRPCLTASTLPTLSARIGCTTYGRSIAASGPRWRCRD